MTHQNLVSECEALGLKVQREPAEPRADFSATAAGVRVYWSVGIGGALLGLPRVRREGMDTHARSLREIRYLVKG